MIWNFPIKKLYVVIKKKRTVKIDFAKIKELTKFKKWTKYMPLTWIIIIVLSRSIRNPNQIKISIKIDLKVESWKICVKYCNWLTIYVNNYVFIVFIWVKLLYLVYGRTQDEPGNLYQGLFVMCFLKKKNNLCCLHIKIIIRERYIIKLNFAHSIQSFWSAITLIAPLCRQVFITYLGWAQI